MPVMMEKVMVLSTRHRFHSVLEAYTESNQASKFSASGRTSDSNVFRGLIAGFGEPRPELRSARVMFLGLGTTCVAGLKTART